MLDAVQDPGNVGTMLRTAAALGAAATLAAPGTVDLWNAKVVRSAMGALFHYPALAVTWSELDSLLSSNDIPLWGADAEGQPVETIAPPTSVALVVGNEGAGLSDDARMRCTRLVGIQARARDRIAQRRRRRRHSPSSLPRVTDAFAPLGSWYFPTIAFLFGACIGSFLERLCEPLARRSIGGEAALALSEVRSRDSVVREHPARELARAAGQVQRLQDIPSPPSIRSSSSWSRSGGSRACCSGGRRSRRFRVAVFGTVLLGIMITDATDYVIPDGFTVFGFFFALVAAGVGTLIGETLPFATLYDSIIGACVGAGAIAIIGWLGELALKKEAMGFGDVTLMAMVGAYLGPGRTLLTIFIGAFLGAIGFLGVVYPITYVRCRRAGIPFAPPLVPFGVFLAPAALIALLWGMQMMHWYAHDMLGL